MPRAASWRIRTATSVVGRHPIFDGTRFSFPDRSDLESHRIGNKVLSCLDDSHVRSANAPALRSTVHRRHARSCDRSFPLRIARNRDLNGISPLSPDSFPFRERHSSLGWFDQSLAREYRNSSLCTACLRNSSISRARGRRSDEKKLAEPRDEVINEEFRPLRIFFIINRDLYSARHLLARLFDERANSGRN